MKEWLEVRGLEKDDADNEYHSARVKLVDEDGVEYNLKYLDGRFPIENIASIELLERILKQLMIMNTHLSILTDNEVTIEEIG